MSQEAPVASVKQYRSRSGEEMATLTVRIACQLKEALERSAQRNRRSLSAELIVLIEAHTEHEVTRDTK